MDATCEPLLRIVNVTGGRGEFSHVEETYGTPVVSVESVEFYLYPTVGTVLIHSVKPELTE